MESCEKAGQFGMSEEEYNKAMTTINNTVCMEEDLNNHITEVVRKYNFLKQKIEDNKNMIVKLSEENRQMEMKNLSLEKTVQEWKKAFELAETKPSSKKQYRSWKTYADIQPLFDKVRKNEITSKEFVKEYEEKFKQKYGEIKYIGSFYQKIKQGNYVRTYNL